MIVFLAMHTVIRALAPTGSKILQTFLTIEKFVIRSKIPHERVSFLTFCLSESSNQGICHLEFLNTKPALLTLQHYVSFNKYTWYNILDSLPQIPTTKNWKCSGSSTKLHMGRHTDKRRWQWKLNYGRMDPTDQDVHKAYSSCELVYSRYSINVPHHNKSWNDSQVLVSIRLVYFTLLRTG
jgi:hypothetical protein